MYTGEISFTLLRVFGIWATPSWDSRLKMIYSFYSANIFIFYSIFLFSLLMYLLRVAEDVDNSIESILYFSASSALMVKMVCILSRRETVIETKKVLAGPLCQPRDSHETEILKKYADTARFNTFVFLILANISVGVRIFAPLAQTDNRALPLKTWTPFSLYSESLFLFTYLYEGLFLVILGEMSIGIESLALMMMLQICAQTEIIAYRLQSLPKLWKENCSKSVMYQYELRLIKDCVIHHLNTYSLQNNFNKLFGVVIFTQFFSSMMNMCIILYQLSRFSIFSEFSLEMIPVLFTVIVQIFIYCYYGEKVTNKSLTIVEAIYQMNWTSVSNEAKKDLLLIMMRASKPMYLSGMSIIIMSLETFVKIMKSAYSAYNLLLLMAEE
ncbi:odorant receptor 46a-like [Belonocnema kinseyi]|uniref:odorant receptor 46a-like n=1 Tax=Belonocnema kinseyi TaxID=2817044 RepID=UPI00143D7919|nr:odorant receptor 46a-like [Belonocnema kinseyi]